MPKTKKERDGKHDDALRPLGEQTGKRSSPGSGEDDGDEAADLQPDDVERSDTAR